jgi:hypothetical protein
MAASLSEALSDASGGVIFGLSIAAAFGRTRQDFKKSFGVRESQPLQGSKRFTATECVPKKTLSSLSQSQVG